MNKKTLKIVLITFVILIIFSSFIKICSAISFDNINIIEDPETIRLKQINNNLDKVHTILLVIQVLISVVHVIKAKKNKKLLVLICSCCMLNFSEIIIFVESNFSGGLFADDPLHLAKSSLISNKLAIFLNILMIGIHIFFIRRNVNRNKGKIFQGNEENGKVTEK